MKFVLQVIGVGLLLWLGSTVAFALGPLWIIAILLGLILLSIRSHCRPVERGWYPEFPPLFNELTPILFGVDLNSKWRFPVTFRTFSDRERHRELWPNAVFANHGFYPMVEFLSSGCEVRRR